MTRRSYQHTVQNMLPSGKLFIINCKESVKAQFVVAVCSEKDASIADLHVIDSHKLEI